ncbi:glutamine synthetase/guanido kinase [Dacryopinax primogenitus]|uniref:Glutamine synthetase n=1 Tax=Dacryopinax primogenitus (strain DJM 731) TaxID=1858805 RepID=M5G1L1_DACPD|nr:glutamine synthetase/guanido kinase [Dacryopinax primogenitus]EJT97637.1 glutamine synthetase/guanido kinase [Dacryopinax primogenitus]
MASSAVDLTSLAEACFTYPSIDNHTHNLLLPKCAMDPPLHIMTTEALGPPLDDVWWGMSHIRARNMLCEVYGLPAGSTWEEMLKARQAMDYEEMCKLNFGKIGIQCLLLDDGLNNLAETCYDYKWHDRLTTSPTKRIVRIEVCAQDIIMSILRKAGRNASQIELLPEIKTQIEAFIRTCVADPEVVGFKSIAAYRTGLDIVPWPEAEGDPVCGLEGLMKQWVAGGTLRISRKEKRFEDWLIRTLLRLIGDKPLQFHTGLGDTHMRLFKGDPAHLQELCEEFPDARIVLLHSAYPYTRQAGYLATCFKNVYLDFGEVFPQVAAHGQRDIIRQMMEITPMTKLLWSTDAHHHPECYYVSTRQSREALFEVISEFVQRGELSIAEAVDGVQKMLFHNSNKAYNLGLKPIPTGLPIPPSVGLSPSLDTARTFLKLDELVAAGIKYVRVSWLDYTNNFRFRLMPTSRFIHVARSSNPGINLTMATLGLGQTDMMARGFSGIGEHLYKFDLSTLRRLPEEIAKDHASVMGWFESKDRSIETRNPLCPRSFVERFEKEAKEKFGATMLVGFETEFILLENIDPPSPAQIGGWSTSLKHRTGSVAAACCEEIASTIQAAGIELQMFHAESGPGQYEIVTGPLPPLAACDAIVLTRDIMYHVAAKYGLKATLVPKPFLKPKADYAASATHAHLSIKSDPPAPGSNHPDVPNLPADFASFMAGVLAHLPAIACFTLSTQPSYARVVDGNWSGGTWVVWGRDNREAPLRLCGGYNGAGFNVELKTLDGTANPYLAIGAVIAAGLMGVEKRTTLTQRNALGIVDHMTPAEREKIGAKLRIPRSWEVARETLLHDREFQKVVSMEVVNAWISVKEAEKLLASTYDDPHKFYTTYY